MSAIIQKHLDAITASMALLSGQIEALRYAVTEPPKQAPAELPARCAGVHAAHCALRDGEWDHGRRSFGNPTVVRCGGCGDERNAASSE